MNQTILVTGITGFAGPHLAKRLIEEGFTVIGTGRSKKPGPGIDALGIKYISCDLTDEGRVNKLPWKDLAGVIHLAGLVEPAKSFEEPLEYMQDNTAMVINLFEGALKHDVKPRMLVVSTGAVYKASDTPLAETSEIFVGSPYAASKLAVETIVEHYRTRGFFVSIARPMNHTGPGQLQGFIAPDIAQQIVTGTNPIQVGNLMTQRDYTDVRDVARAYVNILRIPNDNETYNVCSGVARSGEELLNTLVKAAGIEPPNVNAAIAKLRPGDVPVITGSYQKLNQATGWEPLVPFHETLGDVITFWQERAS